jgi:hypothetical protein
MQEPRWENGWLVADFRATDVCVERFPEDCTDEQEAYLQLSKLVEGLRYQGYIRSKKNSYQVNFNFDDKLHERACAEGQDCENAPALRAPREVAGAVGRKADTLLRGRGGSALVVEVEKANREKILRDIVKMLLFFEALQADLAVLVCPRNYVHRRGVWKVFATARQVLRAFVRVTELPEAKVKRLALIGFTKEVYCGGAWTVWDKAGREELQVRARKHFEAVV